MGHPAKIIYLNKRGCKTESEIIKKNHDKEDLIENIYAIIEKAQRQIDRIEEEWEINHNDVNIRDEIHLMRYFIVLLNSYILNFKIDFANIENKD